MTSMTIEQKLTLADELAIEIQTLKRMIERIEISRQSSARLADEMKENGNREYFAGAERGYAGTIETMQRYIGYAEQDLADLI